MSTWAVDGILISVGNTTNIDSYFQYPGTNPGIGTNSYPDASPWLLGQSLINISIGNNTYMDAFFQWQGIVQDIGNESFIGYSIYEFNHEAKRATLIAGDSLITSGVFIHEAKRATLAEGYPVMGGNADVDIEVECEVEGYSIREGEVDVDIIAECEASGFIGKVATVNCNIEITCEANSGAVVESDIVIEAEGTLIVGKLGTFEQDIILECESVGFVTRLGVIDSAIEIECESIGFTANSGFVDSNIEIECEASGFVTLMAATDSSIIVELAATGYARGVAATDVNIEIEIEATAYVGIVGTVDCDIEVSVEALVNATLTTGVYECKVVNTKTGAVSLYTNFGFDSFAIVNDKVLATSPTGIHELTGDLDETTKIAASITTHAIAPNNPVPRRVMDGQLIGSAAGRIKVTITCDDYPSYEDIVSSLTTAIRRARIKFPEGFSGEHYTFKIENVNGCDFDLDEFKIITQEKSENAEVARNERRVR